MFNITIVLNTHIFSPTSLNIKNRVVNYYIEKITMTELEQNKDFDTMFSERLGYNSKEIIENTNGNLPAGNYLMIFEAAEIESVEKDGTKYPKITAMMKVIDGKNAGRVSFYHNQLKTNQQVGIALSNLSKIDSDIKKKVFKTLPDGTEEFSLNLLNTELLSMVANKTEFVVDISYKDNDVSNFPNYRFFQAKDYRT